MKLICMSLAVLAAAFLATPLLTTVVMAEDFTVGTLKIEHPWSRATAKTAPTGLVYMVIENDGKVVDRLLSASSPVAELVMLHTHIDNNGVMEMREVKSIDIAPASEVKLAPNSLHIMLIGLKAPLMKDQKFPLTLTFEEAASVTVQVEVQGAGDTEPNSGGKSGMDNVPGIDNHFH